MAKDKTLISKLIDGNVVIINKYDYDEVILPVEVMERLLDDTYKRGKSDLIEKAHCEDADCFECAFGSAEKCLLKDE